MRSLSDPSPWIFAAALLCGLVGVPGWVAVPLGVVGGQATKLPKYLGLWDRAQAVGAGHVWWRTLAMSVALAVIVVAGSYAAGRIAALLLLG